MAAKHRLLAFRFLAAAVLAGGALSLSGCHNFFICEKASCPSSGSGGGSGSGDYAYISNSASGSTYVNGYDVSAGKLTAISGFPFNIGFTPVAMAITPGNGYLYVASSVSSTGAIYVYAIGSSGGLTQGNSGTAVAAPLTGVASMDISPDGNFLFVLDALGTALYQYPINSSGLLGTGTSIAVSGATTTPESVRVSPNGNFVVCSLGTSGDVVFPYTSSGGITNTNFAPINTGSVTAGDFGLTIDSNNYLYVARTTGPAVYSVSVPTSTSVTVTSVNQPNTLTVGAGPHPIALNSSSAGYVYVGNSTAGTISTYSNAAGVLSNVSSPVSAPSSIASLARDNSGKYILAAGYNGSSGIQLYTIGSSGTLTSSASAGSGTTTSTPAIMALTH